MTSRSNFNEKAEEKNDMESAIAELMFKYMIMVAILLPLVPLIPFGLIEAVLIGAAIGVVISCILVCCCGSLAKRNTKENSFAESNGNDRNSRVSSSGVEKGNNLFSPQQSSLEPSSAQPQYRNDGNKRIETSKGEEENNVLSSQDRAVYDKGHWMALPQIRGHFNHK